MSTGRLSGVLRELRRTALLHEGGDLTDDRLLECFLTEHDEAAFETLVRRHGPMVMGVCRRVLRNTHDAEDAFQATFLVLVRKATSVVPRSMVANWLYGVAHRTALGAKTALARRRAKESEMPRREMVDEDIWSKLRPLLDETLSHLPDKYRVPILLCDLEGKSRKQAAKQLNWSEGTLSGRLSRARTLLARRLAARGLALSAGALAAALADNTGLASVPAPLLMSTVKAATMLAAGSAAAAGVVPVKVAVLVKGVLRAMLTTKIKIATAWLLAVGVVGGGVGLMTYPTQVAAESGPKNEERLAAPSGPPPIQERAPTMPAKEVLNIQTAKPIANLPKDFFRKYPVQPNGTIYIGGGTTVSVRGQTQNQLRELLARLIKNWYQPNLSIEEIGNRLNISFVSTNEAPRRQSFDIRMMVMKAEKVPGNERVRETYHAECCPHMMLLDGQEGSIGIGGEAAMDSGGKNPTAVKFVNVGIHINVKVTDLRDGRLRVESKMEQRAIERNDQHGSRVAIRTIDAVDLVEPGDPVKVDLKDNKGDLQHFMVLYVTCVEDDSSPKLVDTNRPFRVGAIKIVGNKKIPTDFILQAIPFVSGEVLKETAVRKAEKNLARLEMFEVNPEKNIRPTVQVQDADKDRYFKDIVITVREK